MYHAFKKQSTTKILTAIATTFAHDVKITKKPRPQFKTLM